MLKSSVNEGHTSFSVWFLLTSSPSLPTSPSLPPAPLQCLLGGQRHPAGVMGGHCCSSTALPPMGQIHPVWVWVQHPSLSIPRVTKAANAPGDTLSFL